MANKHLLAALLIVADALGCVAIGIFLQPCPFSANADGDSSAIPSSVPGAGSCDPGLIFCLPLSIYAVWGVQFLVGVLIGIATAIIGFFIFADDIMEAGYFTISGDPEAGGKIQ